MSSIEEVSGKLDQVLVSITDLKKALEASGATSVIVNGGATGVTPAYELPALAVGDVTVDESFVNRDGSVWVWSTGFSPGGSAPSERAPVQKYYGYVSEVKCPEFFEQARRSLGASTVAYREFLQEVHDHPYGIWSSNPGLDATLDGNNVLWGFRVHRVRDWPQ